MNNRILQAMAAEAMAIAKAKAAMATAVTANAVAVARAFVVSAVCAVGATCFIATGALAAEPLERVMNVTKGPDSVFNRPAQQVLPALDDAKATGPNGRIGNELVFWGYELADGRRVDFFACALLADVNCVERVQSICAAPAPTTVLETRETTGKVVQRICRNIAQVAPGDLRPGCEDNEDELALLVGLVQCG